MSALTEMALPAALLLALSEPVAAQNVVSDLPLVGGESERVVFTSPSNPAAILASIIHEVA